MATCHLCPPADRHIADDEVAVHARREHGEAALDEDPTEEQIDQMMADGEPVEVTGPPEETP